jgi:hypothetical protein
LETAVTQNGATSLLHQSHGIQQLHALVSNDVGSADGATPVDAHGTVDQATTFTELRAVNELAGSVKVL